MASYSQLATPTAIADPAWPLAVLDALAKPDALGSVLHALSQPAAIAHPQWPALIGAVCDAKKKAGGTSVGDNELAALLAIDQVKWHEQFASVLAAAKEAFPNALCFAAGSELSVFPSVGAPKLPPPPKAPGKAPLA